MGTFGSVGARSCLLHGNLAFPTLQRIQVQAAGVHQKQRVCLPRRHLFTGTIVGLTADLIVGLITGLTSDGVHREQRRRPPRRHLPDKINEQLVLKPRVANRAQAQIGNIRRLQPPVHGMTRCAC